MSQKNKECCGQNGVVIDQCHDCPKKKYLPSSELLRKMDFWQIVPEGTGWESTDSWRRPQPSGGYLQVVRGLESGIVVISDNHKLDAEEGSTQTVWMKEPYHGGPLIDEAQFKAFIDLATS